MNPGEPKHRGLVYLISAWGLALAGLPAQADVTLDMHGALAQGYVHSWGNDVISNSRDGTNDLFEVIVNGRTTLPGNVLLSGQLLSRKKGTSGEGKIRLDYLQLDKQLWLTANSGGGLRLGRVKNPYGLFNVSRDSVFTRPGITLPSSIYFENSGLRDLFFSADAVQPYGYLISGEITHQFSLTLAPEFDGTEAFGALGASDGEVRVSQFRGAQWSVEGLFDRHLQVTLSYLGADVAYRANQENDPLAGTRISADVYVLSAQWQAEYFSLTGEYRFAEVPVTSMQGHSRQNSDGGYLQLSAWKTRGTEFYLRYDLSFANVDDRDGSTFSAQTMGMVPGYQRFSRKHVAGLIYRPQAEWGVFAEYQYVDGTEGLGAVARSQPDSRYWQVLYLMLGYRF